MAECDPKASSNAPSVAADRAAPAIEVVNLHYAYKNVQALRGVSFEVARRAIHGFVGPNGAGKTTTLKILATLLKPSELARVWVPPPRKPGAEASAPAPDPTPESGRNEAWFVRVFGLDVVKQYKDVRERIGFMPDHFSMYRQMTVFEYLDFFAAAYGMDLARRNAVIADVLKLTDMDGRKGDLIRTLSRGMQQRVSLARVLIHDPDLLLLDEPASGLDPRARIELMEILKELRRIGKTIFISSHILSELATLCDSFTIIDRGVVKYTGSKRGLLTANGAMHTVLVTLAQAHPPVADALKRLEGVADAAPGDDDATYRVSFDPLKADCNGILRAVMDCGGRVVGFQEDSGQINQAFMDLTEPGVPS